VRNTVDAGRDHLNRDGQPGICAARRTKMKAIVVSEYGDVDELELREVPDPKVGPGAVRVKVVAASINPIDWKLLSGALRAWMPLQFPAVLGFDVSGDVLEVGAGVTRLKVGDKVLGRSPRAFAEQVVACEDAFALVPPTLDVRDAAALPVVGLTGAQLVEEAVQPKRGDVLLVTGAVGSVGRVAVYAARRIGARVIAGVRAKQKGAASELGAEQVVALDDDAEIARLPELDSIADTVGGETAAKLLPRLRKGGVFGSVVGEPTAANPRNAVIRAIQTHDDPKRLRELAEAMARGGLRLPIARRFPLAQVAEAMKFASRSGAGKVLLTP
jgi:NADPH:quinone reductase-like Zn-dependent oxidoreductase